MDKVIVWLDGSKTYIASISLLVIPFLTSQGIITEAWGALLAGIVAILMGGGKYITDQAVKTESNLGVSITNNRVKNSNK